MAEIKDLPETVLTLSNYEAWHLKAGLELLDIIINLRIAQEEVEDIHDHVYAEDFQEVFKDVVARIGKISTPGSKP